MIPRRVADARRCAAGKYFRSAVIDDQVPCSGCCGQWVRLETEQPNRFIQVPWSTWSSMTADHHADGA